MLTNKSPIVDAKFTCDSCDYKCSKKSDYDKHILTRKHLNANIKSQEKRIYTCNNCGVSIKHLSSLSRHKKKCLTEEVTTDNLYTQSNNENIILDLSSNEIKILTNLVLQVVKNNSELLQQNQEYQKQNQDLQKQVLDIFQKIQPGSTTINNNNTHTNSHNKTFNLQFFLNEQCKDAMNIMDFVNTFQLQFSDFERIGEVGYVEGISKIIIDKLSAMDIYKRPIHCSDSKREIMYVKDKDVWEKENATNSKIRLAVRHITKKNSDMVRPWAIKYPNALNSEHHLSDTYQIMVIEAMGGNSGTMEQCENKIIKKISKMVLIDKKV